jgi:CBS domain-containing protein
MTAEVVYCFEDDSIRDAAQLMEKKQSRLLVLDRGKRLVGIVSLGDLAAKTHDKPLAGDVPERVSEPAAPVR